MDSGNSIVILIGGGHAAGKRTSALLLKESIEFIGFLKNIDIELVNLEDYEEAEGDKDVEKDKSSTYLNSLSAFSGIKPSRFNFNLVKDKIRSVKNNGGTEKKMFIIYGLYALYDNELRDMASLRVYISADADDRLIRWIRRDVLNASPGVSLESLISTYIHRARIEMSYFIFPTKEFADIILPKGADSNAIHLLVDGIIPLLGEHGTEERLYMPFDNDFLRPKVDDVLNTETIDAKKSIFYELN